MFYEVIIGFGVLLYLLWKYVLSTNQNADPYVECEDTKLEIKDSQTELSNSIKVDNNDLNNYLLQELPEAQQQLLNPNKELEVFLSNNLQCKDIVTPSELLEKIKDKNKTEKDIREGHIPTSEVHKKVEVLKPSIFLEQTKKKILNEKVGKRESPPKEKFAEFLEKTILSDDKIQTIIQNLSLDKTHAVKHDESTGILDYEVQPLSDVRSIVSEKSAKLNESIDQIADKIKQLNDTNIVKQHVDIQNDLTNSNNTTEVNKPLLSRIQKQSGFPIGLNFGSVIGELKSKTKNGGLKPVFKKFDADVLDGSQACILK